MNDLSQQLLPARFLTGLARCPDRPAIRAGDREISYTRAHEVALRWAGALQATAGGRPGAVGVLTDKGPAGYLGLLAALYSGATAVPLHPDFPAARTAAMARAAGVAVLLADGRGRAVLDGAGPDAGLDLPVVPAAEDFAALPGRSLPAPLPAALQDRAYVLFTSGSTGRPKGVPLTHANLAEHFRLMDARYRFGPGDVFSQLLELNFDCAIFELFGAWGAGATVQQVPASAYLDLPGFLARHGVTVWFSTPSAIGLARRLGGLSPGSLPTLRRSFFAGEALRCADAADWQAAAGNAVVENLYGPTELTLTVSGHRWDPERSGRLAVNGVVPIGSVYPGHRYLLLDEHGGAAVDEGELCITGPQMAAGYLDPAHDSGRFLERDSRRWYRTGDRVRRLPGDELAYLGRLDGQVQINGLRVELAEVDHAVRGCPGITDAVTVTRPQGDSLELVTFCTGAPTTAVELAAQLRSVLPAAMIPRAFRWLDELPLNSNRKVDRIRLAAVASAERGSAVP